MPIGCRDLDPSFTGAFRGGITTLSQETRLVWLVLLHGLISAQRPFLDIEEGPLLFAATFPGASCIPKVKLPEARRGGGAEVVLELVGEGADHRALALAAISVQVDPPSRR